MTFLGDPRSIYCNSSYWNDVNTGYTYRTVSPTSTTFSDWKITVGDSAMTYLGGMVGGSMQVGPQCVEEQVHQEGRGVYTVTVVDPETEEVYRESYVAGSEKKAVVKFFREHIDLDPDDVDMRVVFEMSVREKKEKKA